MTTANMKLVVLDVPLDGEMESPDQNLDDGEEMVRRAVEVKDLYRVLKGMLCSLGGRVHGAAVTTTRATFDLIHKWILILSHTDAKNIAKRRSEKTK
jgi:hypothetical protein